MYKLEDIAKECGVQKDAILAFIKYRIEYNMPVPQPEPYQSSKYVYSDESAKEIIEFAKNLIKSKNIESIRVDTHTKNIPMQKFLEKNGFKACGIIYLNNEINEVNKRIAYEYVIKKG